MTNDCKESQSTEDNNDAEFELMTYILPGQEPMSLEELKAHQAQQEARADYDRMIADDATAQDES